MNANDGRVVPLPEQRDEIVVGESIVVVVVINITFTKWGKMSSEILFRFVFEGLGGGGKDKERERERQNARAGIMKRARNSDHFSRKQQR